MKVLPRRGKVSGDSEVRLRETGPGQSNSHPCGAPMYPLGPCFRAGIRADDQAEDVARDLERARPDRDVLQCS